MKRFTPTELRAMVFTPAQRGPSPWELRALVAVFVCCLVVIL